MDVNEVAETSGSVESPKPSAASISAMGRPLWREEGTNGDQRPCCPSRRTRTMSSCRQ